MRALCWHGKGDIRCDNVADPTIENARDVIIKVSSCAICGSDLHLMDGQMPTMESGDVLGHEFMGEVVEVGSASSKFRKGQRIVVPFQITCGECRQCKIGNWSCCQRSNRNGEMAAKTFGLSHRRALRVLAHDGRLFRRARPSTCACRWPTPRRSPRRTAWTTSICSFSPTSLPTGWQGAEQCQIQGGEIIADLGRRAGRPVCGAIGKDHGRRAHHRYREGAGAHCARPRSSARPTSSNSKTRMSTSGSRRSARARAPDGVIDCVGMEAHGAHGIAGAISKVQEAIGSGTQRPYVLNEAIKAVRPGGSVSVPGVYGGPVPLDMGSVVQKGLTIRSGPDKRAALPREAHRADPGRSHRYDLDGHAQEQGPSPTARSSTRPSATRRMAASRSSSTSPDLPPPHIGDHPA